MAAQERDPGVDAGQEVYSDRVLRIYDPLVLWLTNSAVWRCPRRVMRGMYQRNVGARHLEVGVGTGYFLHRCRFPVPDPDIHLVDLNVATLRYASRRLARYQPTTRQANILEPLPVSERRYDSAGVNMVLHCLPGGDLRGKAKALAHVAATVRPGGRVFGSTILAHGVEVNPAARAMLRNHNERGILNNAGDRLEDLHEVMADHFTDHTVWTRGCFALFEATVDA
ncbi:class I SAM-dependent methyltransferase [Streptomyces sp. NPDC005438]|uniref:class I SAM-dependent methyltransferase n=1 Tax=Streptomyces sp. NPDC005438 TaxID=3156880 RepID=UPI0033AA6871